jgi:hypothetical protein
MICLALWYALVMAVPEIVVLYGYWQQKVQTHSLVFLYGTIKSATSSPISIDDFVFQGETKFGLFLWCSHEIVENTVLIELKFLNDHDILLLKFKDIDFCGFKIGTST